MTGDTAHKIRIPVVNFAPNQMFAKGMVSRSLCQISFFNAQRALESVPVLRSCDLSSLRVDNGPALVRTHEERIDKLKPFDDFPFEESVKPIAEAVAQQYKAQVTIFNSF